MVETKPQQVDSLNQQQFDLPSNKQIGQVVDTAQQKLEQVKSSSGVDTHGQVLVSDIQDILNSSKKLIFNINANDQLQQFINDVAEFTKDYTSKLQPSTEQVKSDVYDAMDESRELFLHSKDLVLFIIRSGEFRQLLDDFVNLFRSITSNVQERYGDEGKKVKEAVKKDVNREDTSASATKQKVSDLGEKVKRDVQKGKLIDDEQKEVIRDRLNSIVDRLQKNRDFNMAIDHFNRIFDLFNRRFDQLKKDPNLKLEGNEQFEKLVDEAKGILGNIFGKSYKEFDSEFWDLVNDLREDKDAQKFFNEFRGYLNDAIQNGHKWDKEDAKKKLNKMVDRIGDYWNSAREKYGDRFSGLFDNLYDMMDFAKSEVFGLQDKIYQLVKDAVFDRQGRPDIYITQETLQSLQNIVVPIFRERIANIPLPTISASNDTYDFTFHDVLFDGRNFLPDRFHFRFITDLVLDTKQSRNNQLVSKILSRVDGIDMDLKNLHFHYVRKTMPRLEDSGVCDVSIRNLTLKLSWYIITQKDGPTRMKLVTANSIIESMSITNIVSKHPVIDNIVTTVAKGYIKDQVQKGLIDNLKSYLDPISDQINYYLQQQWNNYQWNKDRWVSEANDKLKDIAQFASDKTKEYKQVATEMVQELGENAKKEKEDIQGKKKKSDVWRSREWEQKWHNHDI